MVTIIKGQKKFSFPSDEVNSIQSTSDGLLMTCTDKSELRLYFNVTPALRAVLNMADKNLGNDITIDIGAAERGDTANIMKINCSLKK